MRNLGKRLLALLMVLMLLAMSTACAGSGSSDDEEEDSAPAKETTAKVTKAETEAETEAEVTQDASEGEVDPDSIDDGTVFDYLIEDRTVEEDGMTVHYPELVEANDADRMAQINTLIQDDLNEFAETVKGASEGGGALTMELTWTHELYSNTALSIAYVGTASTEKGAYPYSIYHTLVINLNDGTKVNLTDAFDVNEDFASAFRGGMYAPTREDLNLEESGVDPVGIIDETGDLSKLQSLLNEPGASFVLASLGVIVSIPVAHAAGDHLEMGITYESIESCMKRDTCTVWSDYLAMSDGGGAAEESGADASGMILYENGRFGYSLHYPDIFGDPVESENGDGITLESADGKVKLLIWAGYNLEPVDGAALLAETEGSVAGIVSSWSSDAFYGLTFDGGDADPIRFVEAGYAGTDASVHFRMSFPLEDEAKYQDALTAMTNELMIN